MVDETTELSRIIKQKGTLQNDKLRIKVGQYARYYPLCSKSGVDSWYNTYYYINGSGAFYMITNNDKDKWIW
jgi:hypothetical protein